MRVEFMYHDTVARGLALPVLHSNAANCPAWMVRSFGSNVSSISANVIRITCNIFVNSLKVEECQGFDKIIWFDIYLILL